LDETRNGTVNSETRLYLRLVAAERAGLLADITAGRIHVASEIRGGRRYMHNGRLSHRDVQALPLGYLDDGE
jgi:hypothetical protein